MKLEFLVQIFMKYFYLDEYFSKTIHVLPYYQNQNKVTKVNGIGKIDDIFEQISGAIDSTI